MREIKFRAWDKEKSKFIYSQDFEFDSMFWMTAELASSCNEFIQQYTGLKDKNGKEIYELCELDKRYIVVYKSPKFCLYDILKCDIIDFNDKNKYEITTEYKPLSKDNERSID